MVGSAEIASRRAGFIRDLEGLLHLLDRRLLVCRVPALQGLFRRRPRSHFHTTPELFWQTGGRTDFICPDRPFRLKKGEVCVMPRGVPHAETPRDTQTPYGILVCMQSRDGFMLHRARADRNKQITGHGTDHLASPRGREAFRYLDEIALSDLVIGRHRPAFVSGLLHLFFVTLLSEMHRPSAAEPSRTPQVAEAEKLARANLADPKLTVAYLARQVGCSADYLSRRFHQERKTTLSSWIVRERVEMARELMQDSRCNVAEVGWACGFNAPSYFIQVFRRYTGMTPRQFRLSVGGRGG